MYSFKKGRNKLKLQLQAELSMADFKTELQISSVHSGALLNYSAHWSQLNTSRWDKRLFQIGELCTPFKKSFFSVCVYVYSHLAVRDYKINNYVQSSYFTTVTYRISYFLRCFTKGEQCSNSVNFIWIIQWSFWLKMIVKIQPAAQFQFSKLEHKFTD